MFARIANCVNMLLFAIVEVRAMLYLFDRNYVFNMGAYHGLLFVIGSRANAHYNELFFTTEALVSEGLSGVRSNARAL